MTNWKTYEASIRLIAAILAAHPDLKLNYNGKHTSFYFLEPNLSTPLFCLTFTSSLHVPFISRSFSRSLSIAHASHLYSHH